MERNVMGELNVYRGSGAKPNFSEIARRHGMDRHTVAKLCFATLIFGFSRLIIFGFHVFRQGRTASSPNSQTCPS